MGETIKRGSLFVGRLDTVAWSIFHRTARRLGLSYQYRMIGGRWLVWSRPAARPALRALALAAALWSWSVRGWRRARFWLPAWVVVVLVLGGAWWGPRVVLAAVRPW